MHLSPLFEAIASWCDWRRWRESFEEFNGEDFTEMFEISFEESKDESLQWYKMSV